jgi:hypothetical protein
MAKDRRIAAVVVEATRKSIIPLNGIDQKRSYNKEWIKSMPR